VARVAQVIVPSTVLNVVVADPDDNRILECAIDAQVDVVVSNDKHLLALKAHGGIAIVSGAAFRRVLGLT